MGKQILVMTGSPRKGGNSDQLADAFIRGAQEKGHQVDRFAAAHHDISGCRACETCWSKGAPCSFSDAFNSELAPLLERAEVLVFAVPLYTYGFPAQIKAPMDRLYAYVVPQAERRLQIRESALLLCGADEGEESYGGAVESYRQLARFTGWEDRGVLLATGFVEKGAVAGSPCIGQSEALGRSI